MSMTARMAFFVFLVTFLHGVFGQRILSFCIIFFADMENTVFGKTWAHNRKSYGETETYFVG